MIDWLCQEYKSIFEDRSGQMTVSRCRVHKYVCMYVWPDHFWHTPLLELGPSAYLGMTLDYTIHGQVNILMFDYINEIIDAFDKAEWYKVKCCSQRSLRGQRPQKAPAWKTVEFHNLVAKTLYTSKWARPNTWCTAIGFLITRVQVPDKDDWSKLVHLMAEISSQRHAAHADTDPYR